MVGRGLLLLCALAAGSVLARPPHAPAPLRAQEIPLESVGRSRLLPADIVWLENPAFHWKHLQTEHFVLHAERKMFATKVARLGEQFYDAISGDLPALKDRVSPDRSHIFIFRDPKEWATVVVQSPGLEPWAASFVRDNTMYLQEIGKSTSKKMDMLAHEMTHLVFNRFLTVRLPLWLNEGLAEYYGTFAYRAAKGMGQSKKNSFRPLRKRMPLSELLTSTTYPTDPAEVTLFYTTSKYLTGFLLLKNPREQWDRFFARVLAGEAALPALLDTYGWADIGAMEEDFARFAR